jgi:hypothetical protein
MTLDQANALLGQYNGGTGRLWHYTVSHDRIALQLAREDRSASIFLVMVGCTELSGPTLWTLNRPTLVATDTGYVFNDALKIASAHEFQFAESYQP